MGGSERLLEYSLRTWNATTRWGDDSIISRRKHGNYWHGDERVFGQQIHNEYYNLATPGGTDWHHMGEGNLQFYDFGVAEPTISENVRRAKRFAAMFMGEDPEADNYDRKYKIFRSPVQSSVGPYKNASVDRFRQGLAPGRWQALEGRVVPGPTGAKGFAQQFTSGGQNPGK